MREMIACTGEALSFSIAGGAQVPQVALVAGEATSFYIAQPGGSSIIVS